MILYLAYLRDICLDIRIPLRYLTKIYKAYPKRYLCDMLNIYLMAGEGNGAMIVSFRGAQRAAPARLSFKRHLAACLARAGKAHPASSTWTRSARLNGPRHDDRLPRIPARPISSASVHQHSPRLCKPTAVPRLSVVPSSLRLASVAGCHCPLRSARGPTHQDPRTGRRLLYVGHH